MTNIKGMETYVAPAVKTTPAQKDSSVKPAENSDSFENQLNDAVNSTAGKDTQGKKPVRDKDTEETAKETKGQEYLPIEGLPLTDITVPILTDDGSTTDLLRGLTERSAAVVIAGYGEAAPLPANPVPTLPVQQPETPVTGEEVQNAFAKTDAAVKELTGQRDAAVTKTDTSGFGIQQLDTKQSGVQQIDAKQSQLQQPDTKQSDGQQVNARQADTRQVDTGQADTRQVDTGQDHTRQVDTRQVDTRQADTRQADTRQADTRQADRQQADTKQIQNFDSKPSGIQQSRQQNQAAKPAEIPQGQTQSQAPLQQQSAGTLQNDGLVKADMESITVTSQTEQPADTKKTGEPTEVYQDVSAVKQNRLEPETPVRIKVAEPYKTLDTDAVKQLAARISEGAAMGNKELIIQLTPENLGKISIKIATEADGVKVILSCENQKTLGLLSDKATGISHIVENNLNQHAVVEIKEDGYWNQQKNATDQHTGQQGRQQEEQNSDNGQQDDMDNFIQQLRLGMHTGEIAV